MRFATPYSIDTAESGPAVNRCVAQLLAQREARTMQGVDIISRLAWVPGFAALRRCRYRCRSAAATRPLSRNFGWERGTPVDRLYIEQFLSANASDIAGRVLEVGDDSYSQKYGGMKVRRQDILHVNPANPKATIVGDLCDPAVLPSAAFDCIVITQTLHLLWDLRAGMRQLHRAMAPGGKLLLTVPGISPVDPYEWNDSWYWSLNRISVERLLAEHFAPSKRQVDVCGNLYSATAFLHGAVLDELNPAALEKNDPVYPVVICARAIKPPTAPT